jgi:Tfp pilus assembly protein PilF
MAYVNLEELEWAAADFTKAIELDPANYRAYRLRGDVYHARGNCPRPRPITGKRKNW